MPKIRIQQNNQKSKKLVWVISLSGIILSILVLSLFFAGVLDASKSNSNKNPENSQDNIPSNGQNSSDTDSEKNNILSTEYLEKAYLKLEEYIPSSTQTDINLPSYLEDYLDVQIEYTYDNCYILSTGEIVRGNEKEISVIKITLTKEENSITKQKNIEILPYSQEEQLNQFIDQLNALLKKIPSHQEITLPVPSASLEYNIEYYGIYEVLDGSYIPYTKEDVVLKDGKLIVSEREGTNNLALWIIIENQESLSQETQVIILTFQ